MASRRIIPLPTFTPKKTDIITLDSNILIKLLYPAMCESDISPYEALYSRILSIKPKLLISSIQISEFINRCIRFQFELYRKANKDIDIEFKRHYRGTEDYRNSMNAILDIIATDIVPNFEFINDNFQNMDSNIIFQYGFSYDFNDSILLEIARQNNAILITDDKDFANYTSSVQIVTNNRTLLMFS